MVEFKYYSPEPINKNKSEILLLAEEFANDNKFYVGDRIEPLIERLGGQIDYFDPDADNNDSYFTIVHKKNDFVIRVPAYLGLERTRFSLAHELGHYVLHSNFGERRTLAMFFSTSLADQEANWFASGLLMPIADFIRTCNKYNNDYALIAARYMVSSRAVAMRIECQ